MGVDSPQEDRTPGNAAAAVRGVQVGAAALLLTYVLALSTRWGREGGFVPLVDGWLQCGVHVTLAALVGLRAWNSSVDRGFWALLATSLGLRALGFVVYVTTVRTLVPVPYPSAADACWVLSVVVLGVALAELVRTRFRRLTTALVIDSVIGLLATACVLVAFLYPLLVAVAAPGVPADVLTVNLAYPILDAAVVSLALGLLVAHRWRPPPAVWALALGVTGFAVTDAVFLHQAVTGTFRPGGPLSVVAVTAEGLIGLAAWLPDRRRREQADQALFPGIVVPCLFSGMAVLVLALAPRGDAWLLTLTLAASTLAVSAARIGLAHRDLRADALPRQNRDPLTGVLSRAELTGRLELLLDGRPRDASLSLLLLDVNDFRGINERYGHRHGDEVLVELGSRLERAVRPSDLLGRIGGDEFCVVVADADADAARHVAERLHEATHQPVRLGVRDVEVTVSAGIAVFPQDGIEATALLQHADLARQDARTSGIDHGFFRHQRHTLTRERIERVDRLRSAIETDEVVVHYQPQVSLTSGEVTGVEALVRWLHPTEGLLLPDRFIRLAESGGLMRMLTQHVLDTALRQCALWRDVGHDPVVAVNLSVTNLLDPELPGRVATLLESSGVPADRLVLELTEDLFVADPERAGQVMADLTSLGCVIAVDDYGTGYASLGYLRDLRHVGVLKLDRSFVRDVDTDPRARAIVESTLTLTRSLDLDLVAEGVETTGVRDTLTTLGCSTAQGFLFSRPVPPEQVRFGVLDAARPAADSR